MHFTCMRKPKDNPLQVARVELMSALYYRARELTEDYGEARNKGFKKPQDIEDFRNAVADEYNRIALAILEDEM